MGRILIDMGAIKEADLNIALACQRGMEPVTLEGFTIDPEIIQSVPPQIATNNKVLPIAFDPATKSLTVVMASHENFRALDDLRQLMGYHVTAKVADAEQIDRLIAKYYQADTEGLSEILSELQTDESLKDLKNRGESIDIDSL